MHEVGIFSLIGRCGSTFLRNQLGKYDDMLCLTSDAQIKLFNNLKKGTKLNNIISSYIKYDIKEKFSSFKVKKEKINFVIYKMPLTAILFYLVNFKDPLQYAIHIKPIFMVRNPVNVILSASKKTFIKQATPLDKFFYIIYSSYKYIGLDFPHKEKREFYRFRKLNNIIMQNAVLLKLSLNFYNYYFNKIYNNPFLLLSFEDFIDNPVRVMKILLEYITEDKKYTGEYIKYKLEEIYFYDIIEEGGINMKENLDKTKKNNYNLYSKLSEDIYNYLNNEILYLGYSRYNNNYPKTKYIRSLNEIL